MKTPFPWFVETQTMEEEKIFELFIRSADVTDFEDSGVCLSIVHRIMGMHASRIRVESIGKSGSVFYVDFKNPEEDALPE